ncbi:Zn-dependent alcohol dehydrogenase [Streptomyces sp. NPDC047023]|uniref:Zn-dependent alcohol dehydrogenase n=1 Tax=Streptomyces sp. NPDC047023 TaxID=3155139 RepID=UPI0033CAA670
MVRAAILPAVGAPLEIRDIVLPAPGPGQVRVRLAAAGVCHSDLSLTNGTMRVPVPAVLGHEGAGTVLAVGEGVTHVAPGDGVVLNWAPSCGRCHHCAMGEVWLCVNALTGVGNVHAHDARGTELHPGLNVAAFAEETVVAAGCVLPAPEGIPLAEAALLGCAVLTGYGAVHHSAQVRPGESVAVFGVGGVGLAALQAARVAEAGPVIAVDVSPAKEELARAAGATEFVLAGAEGAARQVRALTGGHGADVAVECVGRAESIRAAWESTRRGGRTTVVGIGGKEQQVTFHALEIFHFARTLTGCVYGNSDPARDLPVIAEHVRAGRMDLGALVTDRIGLDDIPAAFDAMLAGKGGRSLVVFP